jgi:hypothetical protein
MPNTKDWVPGKMIQVLVYGPKGSGKTWGALTFPRPNIMDFDKGIATVRHPAFVKKHGLLSIQYEQFTEKKMRGPIPLDHNAYDDACRYFDEWMAADKVDTFDTWVIGSSTVEPRWLRLP